MVFNHPVSNGAGWFFFAKKFKKVFKTYCENLGEDNKIFASKMEEILDDVTKQLNPVDESTATDSSSSLDDKRTLADMINDYVFTFK